MLKVLHVYKTYYPDTFGGVEQMIRQLCISTQLYGIEHRILTLSSHPQPEILNFTEADVYRIKTQIDVASTPMSFNAFKKFRKLAAWADIIHYHFPWPFADLLNLFLAKNKPRIVTYHSDIIKQKYLNYLYQPLMHHFLKTASCIVAESPNYANSSRVLQKYTHKIEVIPIGLNERSYPMAANSLIAHWQQQYGKNFFLFVGVLRYYKGLYTLLDAAKLCSYPIVIAGKGPEETTLKAIAQHLPHVKFVGAITDEDKIALYQLAKAIVFPSQVRTEAFGITLVEGAMFSKPLISCEIGTGTSFINQHQQTGLVIEPQNPTALVNAMRELSENPALCEQYGQAARHRYEALFQASQMAKSYVELYKKILFNF